MKKKVWILYRKRVTVQGGSESRRCGEMGLGDLVAISGKEECGKRRRGRGSSAGGREWG